jgi:DNA ligase-1
MDFKLLQKVVDELNSTNSTNDKKVILAKYKNDEFIKKVLYYTYNPFYQYYVTPATLEKNYDDDLGTLYKFSDLFEMLDILRKREVTGHKAINSVNDFCYKHEEFKDLIYKIIGKDLEIRMGDSLINKIIPNLIPTFDVALATPFEDVEVDFATDTWYASRKLDGVRCLGIVDENGKVSLWSRQGNQFETLKKVEDEIASLGLTDVVFDGEICLTNKDGSDDFQGVMKQIRKKDHTIDNPKYLIFDLVTGQEFEDKIGFRDYSVRYHTLRDLIINKGMKHLELVHQSIVMDTKHYIEQMENADANKWEGLILRKNRVYEGKRTKNMLKCKSFHDAEYTVIDLEFGPFRMIENGLEITKDVLSNVVIEHKGNKVSVGSGFTIEEREFFKANPNEILNKVITVKYFEETQNQSGNYSLRFPTVKVIHGNKRTV